MHTASPRTALAVCKAQLPNTEKIIIIYYFFFFFFFFKCNGYVSQNTPHWANVHAGLSTNRGYQEVLAPRAPGLKHYIVMTLLPCVAPSLGQIGAIQTSFNNDL